MNQRNKVSPEVIEQGIKQSFSWLNWLAVTALIFGFLATLSRHFDLGSIPILGISVPFEYSQFVFGVFTVIHLFILKHIVDASWEAWSALSVAERLRVHDGLVRTGGILIKGGAYYKDEMFEQEGKLYLKTNPKSAETWVHVLLVVLSFAAMVDLEWSFLNYLQFSVAMAIVSLNWQLGTNLLLVLGDLGRNEEKSFYFKNGKKGVRPFSTISGFWINDPASYGSLIVGSFVSSFVGLLLLGVLLFAAVGGVMLLAGFLRWLLG